MSDAATGQAPPSRTAKGLRKRWPLYAAVGGVVLAAGAYELLHGRDAPPANHTATPPAAAVFPIQKKPPPTLGIEYHVDRNAIADSRLVKDEIVELTTSGHLLTLGTDSFAVRKERILRRRATCLGPADATAVLAGLANGAIVRVSLPDLSLERVAQVPGTPRWIAVRSQGGGLLVAYQPAGSVAGALMLIDLQQRHSHDVGLDPVLFLDRGDRLWSANADKIRSIDLGTQAEQMHDLKLGGAQVRGFAELSDGQLWAFGGSERGVAGFVARLPSEGKPVVLYAASAKPRSAWQPTTPISHVLEDEDRIVVVSRDNVAISDRKLSTWAGLDGMTSDRGERDAFLARGQAHLSRHSVLLNLVRGGLMEVTRDYAHRHRLEGQIPLSRPSDIARLADGVAFYGDGGPAFYANGGWHPLPDPVLPPAELMGPGRAGENERTWAAAKTIPIEDHTSYVITKAGPPRHYVGHMHGLRDVFLTARWDGAVLTVLGREELPIEPDDTFVTPDKQLWNVDNQGLWNFDGGHWRLVMRMALGAPPGPGTRATGSTAGAAALGESLHFAHTLRSPFHGLPRHAASWSLVRLDSNDAGGVPLIDEIPVKVDGRRAQLRDLTVWGSTKDGLLLATDRGLCLFNIKFGNCDARRPDGLDGQVTLFMRDGTKRLWLGGGGLWVLRDDKHADAIHPAVPMLADTEVVNLAEAQDGRLVIGTSDRGVVFVDIPQGWFQRPAEPVHLEPWEAPGVHEPVFADRSVVLQVCDGRTNALPEASWRELVAELRRLAARLGGRTRVELEAQFEGTPDVAFRGADLEALLDGVRPVLDKPAWKGKLRVKKRFGGPASESIEIASCP